VDKYAAQGDGDKAESLLQKILNKEPHHIETLVRLAEVHTVLGNEHGRLSAYDRLCEAYAQRGNYEKAVDVAEQLVGLEPENSQHRDRLLFLKSRLGDPADGVRGASVDVEIPGIDMEVDPDQSEDVPETVSTPQETDPTGSSLSAAVDSEPIPVLSPEDEEYIKEKVIEAEVFVRYGLLDKAIDQLKNVLQSYRFHTGVREKLIEIYRDEGMRREASEELAELAGVYRRLGDEEKAQQLVQEAGDSGATSDFVAENEDDSVEEPSPESAGPVPESDLSPEVEIPDIPFEDEELAGDESEIDWDIPTKEPQAPGESADEGEAIAEPTLASEVAESSAPLSTASASVLEEVDEYIAMGLYEDAQESLRELLKEDPENPELLSKVEELGFSVSQLQAEATPASLSAGESHASIGDFLEPEPEAFLDLASALSNEMFGTQSAVQQVRGVDESNEPLSDPGLDAVFREFKKGVEKQLGTEDYDTRYNLGIAYKEMGLLDEAIAEFQLAAKDDARLLECCSLLGLCFMEKGMHTIAIKWFEKGLSLPDRNEEEYLGLRYDLARAHETRGDIDRALDLYEDIYRVHARFRDVSYRVQKLQAARN
jgi:tetratricopeptide (TPR) repeat protein